MFTPEFQAQVVLAILTGADTLAELCRKHGLKSEMVSHWKPTFLAHAPVAFTTDTRVSLDIARIAELERLVGQLTMELTVAKKSRPGFRRSRPAEADREGPRAFPESLLRCLF